ncbi:MAG: DUF5667 domain-containing protein [bacterium]|nr:DUF5667 domain-containing protein [bacterium]
MNERNLIKKIQTLNRIQPSKDWVVLTKSSILNQEFRRAVPTESGIGQILGSGEAVRTSRISEILEVFQILPRFSLGYKGYKPALVAITFVGLLVGVFGFAQNALPGSLLYPVKKMTERAETFFVSSEKLPEAQLELANRRLTELNQIVQNNQVKNMAPAINEFRQSMVEAADRLKIVDGSPKLTRGIVDEAGKLKENKEKIEALGVVVGETKEFDEAYSQWVEKKVEEQIKDLEGRSLTPSQEKLLEKAKEDYQKGGFEQALEGLLLLSYPQQ